MTETNIELNPLAGVVAPTGPKIQPEAYVLTDEHRALLPDWAARWTRNALRTVPQSNADRETIRVSMRGLYQSAENLPPPKREIFCPSPLSAAIAAPIAAGVHYLRRHPEEHVELFGRKLTEAEIQAMAFAAADKAVRAGIDTLTRDVAGERAAAEATAAAR